MELLSIVPLASNSCPHRSLMSSAHKPQPFWRTMHTLRMTRKRKSALPSMNMSLTTVVSGDGVIIIQLLSTPYGEPAYRDRADRLVGEVKEIFNSLTLTPLSDLLQRLSMVDSVERLGIDRHFKNEIKSALNYLYSDYSPLCGQWEDCIDSFMQEAKWIATGELPTFEEYYENGKVSCAHRISALQPILTTDISFPHHILKEVDFPSKLNDLAFVVLRLRGDTRCYKADKARGEEASSISCYMKDNPGSTEEDALNHINAMISDVIKGLNWELLKPDNNVPIAAKKHVFDISRAFHYGYKYRDSYRSPNLETKSLVMTTLLEPVPM